MSKSNADYLSGKESLGTSKAQKPSSIPVPKIVVTSAMTTRSMTAAKRSLMSLTDLELEPHLVKDSPVKKIPMNRDLQTAMSVSPQGSEDVNRVGQNKTVESSSLNMSLFGDINRDKEKKGVAYEDLVDQISYRTYEWNEECNNLSVPSRQDTIESEKESLHKSRKSKISIGSTTVSEKIRIRELDHEFALAKMENEKELIKMNKEMDQRNKEMDQRNKEMELIKMNKAMDQRNKEMELVKMEKDRIMQMELVKMEKDRIMQVELVKMEMEKKKLDQIERMELAKLAHEKDKLGIDKEKRMLESKEKERQEKRKMEQHKLEQELKAQEKVDRQRMESIRVENLKAIEEEQKNKIDKESREIGNSSFLNKSTGESLGNSNDKPFIIAHSSGRIEVPKMMELDFDIDNYLVIFERTARGQGWAREKWVSFLSAQFNRKSQDIYARIANEECQDYEIVKRKLLEGYNLGPEAYRKKFKFMERNTRENFKEYAIRLKETMQKWLLGEECNNYDSLVEYLLLERFHECIPKDLTMMLKDRKIKTIKEASIIADELDKTRDRIFSQTLTTNKTPSHHNHNNNFNRQVRYESSHSYNNDKYRHASNKPPHDYNRNRFQSTPTNNNYKMRSYSTDNNRYDNRNNYNSNRSSSQQRDQSQHRPNYTNSWNYPNKFQSKFHHVNNYVSNSGTSPNLPARAPINCAFCKKTGHSMNNCYTFKLQCEKCNQRGHRTEHCKNKPNRIFFIDNNVYKSVFGDQDVQDAYVENVKVRCLKDSGSSITLLNKAILKNLNFTGEYTVCSTAFNTKHSVPLAFVNFKGKDGCGVIKIGVVENLPYDMILGTDLNSLKLNTDEFCAAITRSKSKVIESQSENLSALPRQMLAHYKSPPLEPIEEENIPTIGDEQIQEQLQEQNDKFKFEALQGIGKTQFINEQQTCGTLTNIRNIIGKVMENNSSKKEVTHYFMHKNLIYRKYYFPSISKLGETSSVRQLVIPVKFRRAILSIAHDEPLASHVGIAKVKASILKRFYWPNIFRDIYSYVTSCEKCQKVGKLVKRAKAPMIMTPTKSKPFEKIIIDIVGPLEKSLKGNIYMLVCIDVHSHYPEVFPLRTVDSKHIANELINLFSRVGLPTEIQSDQGQNLISNLMQQFYRVLGVRHIKSSAFHPETNALCERLNGTIKKLIKTCLVDKDKRLWDTILPLVLFSIRSSKHSTTGFSPFELLYGYDIRGPLDIVKELWVTQEAEEDNLDLYEYIIKLRETMRVLSKVAVEREVATKTKIKTKYDIGTKDEMYAVGEKVYVLLPHKINSLSPIWSGPYEILKVLGPVDYLILLHDRVKKQRVVHYNMLRKYQPRISCFIINREDFEVEVPASFPESVTRTMSSKDVKINDDIPEKHKEDLIALLTKFDGVFSDLPGSTDVLRHQIRTIDEEPIKLPQYPVPQALKALVQKELDTALSLGIIKKVINEINPTNYASPTILVKKQTEGEYRLVCDFRSLNKKTILQHYPVSNPMHMLDKVSSAAYLSICDLTRGYNQIKIVEEDIHKTGFLCLGGHYVCQYMAFGLCGSASSFQLMIDLVLQGMENYAISYIDDICIYSNTWKEHLQHIENVLKALQNANLTVKPTKVQLGRTSVRFLGHFVGGGHKSIDHEKVKILNDIRIPRTKKDIRAFLGFIGFYRAFIDNFSELAVPLTDLLRKESADLIPWTEETRNSFNKLRESLQKAPVLISPNFQETFYVMVDSSAYAMGGVLCQKRMGVLHPILFISKKFSPTESKLAAIEREALGVMIVLIKLKYYLVGRKFTLIVDAKPLVYLKQSSSTNAKLLRWSLRLSEFEYTIEHIAGIQHVVADYLSRYISFTDEWNLLKIVLN